MNKDVIETNNAPSAIGPYSQAVKIGNFLYTSGQLPVEPKTGQIVSEDVKEQAKQVMENLKGVLNAAGMELENVVKAMVFIKDMNDFGSINEVYGQYFKKPYPARSCVEVARLPKDVKIEIEVIAYK